MHALGFTANDLEANRQVTITDIQKRKLRQKRLFEIVMYGLVTAFVAGVFLYSIPTMQLDSSNNILTRIIDNPAIGIMAGVLIVVGVVIFKWYQIKLELDNGKASVITGRAVLGMFPTKGTHYKLEIGNFEFEIPASLHGIIEEGQSYNVYYSPNSKFVLSIEKVSN